MLVHETFEEGQELLKNKYTDYLVDGLYSISWHLNFYCG